MKALDISLKRGRFYAKQIRGVEKRDCPLTSGRSHGVREALTVAHGKQVPEVPTLFFLFLLLFFLCVEARIFCPDSLLKFVVANFAELIRSSERNDRADAIVRRQLLDIEISGLAG